MSQQNPWKKQMMQNKAQQQSPISKFPPQESTSPPWLKNKQQQPQANSNPPPWMKNNLNNTTNTTTNSNTNNPPNNISSPSVPPWMKNKQPSTTPNQPAWMKNNTNSNNEPQSSNQPAWMKNNNNTSNNESQGSNVPAWKAGGTMFGGDKKKKQEQERLRKQQQQKLRVQKEQQQRIQRQRLQAQQLKIQQLIKQKQQQVIQTKRMAQQQAYSIARQQHDKEQQQQQLRNKKSSQKHKLTKTPQKPQPKSLKKPAAQKSSYVPSAQSPVTVRYLYHFGQGINQTLEYKERLEQQERLVKVSKGYAEFMEGRIKEIVERDATVQQSSKRVISQYRKNTIINMQSINTQVYYALCQGQQPQPSSSTSSHPISPNTSHQKPLTPQQQSQPHPPSIFFNLSSLQRLLRVFSLYQKLTQTFITLSKKHPSSLISKFRVPLFIMLDYKGIRFLCESYVMEILEAQSVVVQECKEIGNQWGLVEKEMKDRYKVSVGKGDVMVKKVYVDQLGEEVYMFQLKNWDIKFNLPNLSIQHLTTDYHHLTQSITSQYLTTKPNTIPQTQFQIFSKVRTSAFSQLSDLAHLSQAISIVYASCQGEVEGKEFWELILQESEEIWNLIRCAGYKGKLYKNRRLLFVLFEMMTGVRVRFVEGKKGDKRKNEQLRKVKEKISVKEVRCIRYGYALQKLEINELIRNFEKYLNQNKFQLAQHSLSALTSLQSPQNPTPSFQLILKQSKLLSSTNKPHSAIKLLQEYSKSPIFDHKAYCNIEVKMQLLVLYIRVRKQKRILSIFKQLLQLVQFYYGNQSLLNAILYQMLASYYAFKAKSQLTNKQQSSKPTQTSHIITLYQHALSIILKHYGDQSQHIAQVYLSRSVAFLNIKNLQLFYKDIEHALKIYKTHSKQKDKIAECMVYKGKAKILQGNPSSIKQGLQMIEQSAMLYHKLGYYAECADALIFVIEVMQTKDVGRMEVIAQQLIDTVLNYVKVQKFVKKTLSVVVGRLDEELKKVLVSQDQREGTEGQRNNEDKEEVKDFAQLLNKLEDILKGFSSFAQMIRWLGFTANPTLKARFTQITQTLTSLMSIKQQQQQSLLQQQQSQEEQPNKSQSPSQIHSNSQKQLFKGFSEIHSQQSETSPIKRYKQDLDDRFEGREGYGDDGV